MTKIRHWHDLKIVKIAGEEYDKTGYNMWCRDYFSMTKNFTGFILLRPLIQNKLLCPSQFYSEQKLIYKFEFQDGRQIIGFLMTQTINIFVRNKKSNI